MNKDDQDNQVWPPTMNVPAIVDAPPKTKNKRQDLLNIVAGFAFYVAIWFPTLFWTEIFGITMLTTRQAVCVIWLAVVVPYILLLSCKIVQKKSWRFYSSYFIGFLVGTIAVLLVMQELSMIL